jgi:hypothetical protein
LMEHLHLLAAELGIEVEEVTREEAVEQVVNLPS